MYDARYYYNELKNYPTNAVLKDNSRWSGYECGLVEIHHKGDPDTWYTISKDGRVSKETRLTFEYIPFEEIEGDDFELFSSTQAFKTGYVYINGCMSSEDIKKIILDIYSYMKSINCVQNDYCDEYIGSQRTRESMVYCSSYSDLDIYIQSIDHLVRENMIRKYCYNLKCFPYEKYVSQSKCFYVAFIENIHASLIDIDERCNDEVNELLKIVTKVSNYPCSWIDCTGKYPIYA